MSRKENEGWGDIERIREERGWERHARDRDGRDGEKGREFIRLFEGRGESRREKKEEERAKGRGSREGYRREKYGAHRERWAGKRETDRDREGREGQRIERF